MSIDTRLAVYGSLAPGRSNHAQLAGLTGRWRAGTVRGRLINAGWAAGAGYPALIPDGAGDAVPVQLFESADLPAHWDRLDAFEGEDYRRVAAPVELAGKTLEAWIYASAT